MAISAAHENHRLPNQRNRTGQHRKLIVMYTYWQTDPDADELAVLRFVNESNAYKIMLQFSYNAELERFYGHYAHPYHVGLLPPHVLKLCQKFSSIFQEVVDEGIAEGIIMPLPECLSDNDADANAATGTDTTVH